MSLNKKILAAVDKAFNAVGDLVIVGKLSSKKVSTYDFSTNSVKDTSSTLSVEVIITTTTNQSGSGPKISAIMKAGTDLSVYDTLTVKGKNYNISDYSDDGYVITLNLVKEK